MFLDIRLILLLIAILIPLFFYIRRRTVAARPAAIHYLQDFFEQAHDLVQSVTIEGRFEYVNQRWLDTLEYTREESKALHFMDVVHPDSQAHCQNIFTRLQHGENFEQERLFFISKSGRKVILEGNLISSMERGRFVATRGILRDISEQVEAQITLQESEGRYRMISNLMSDYAYAFRVEPGGQLVREWVTGAVTHITGFTPQELDLSDWTDLIHDDDIGIVMQRMRRLMQGQAHICEFRIVTKGGGIRWLRDHAHPIIDDEQEHIMYIYGAAQDITAQKEAGTALRTTNAQLAATLNALPDLMFEIDPTGKIFDYHIPTESDTLYGTGSLLGKNVFELHPKNSSRIIKQAVERGLKNGYDSGATYSWNLTTGQRWFEISIAIKGEQSLTAQRLIVLIRDVTRRRHSELELARHTWNVERLAEFSHTLNTILNFGEILDITLKFIAHSIDVTSIYFCDWEAKAKTSTVLAEYIRPEANEQEKVSDLGVTYSLPDDFGDDGTWLSEQPIHSYASRIDQPALPNYERQHIEQYGGKSTLTIPVVLQNQPIGYIEAWDSKQPRDFTDPEVRFCEAVAHQAAVAIENSRLYDEVTQQTIDLSTLLEASRTVSSTLHLEGVLALISQQMVTTMDVAVCKISRWMPESDTMQTWIVAYRDEQRNLNADVLPTYGPASHPLIEQVLEIKRSMTIGQDDRQNNPQASAFLQETSALSVLLVPLIVGERVIGLLELGEDIYQREFTMAEIGLCQAMANQAAVAIENALLYQQTLNSEAKYRTLFENATDFIWTADLQGNFTDANRAAEAVVGYALADLRGISLLEMVLPEQRHQVFRAFHEVYRTGLPMRDVPVKVQVKDGRVLDLEVSAALLHESDEIVGFQGIARDVTQRLQMERELSRSEKLAAVGQLAAGVAHEVNNPLAIIRSTIQLLMRKFPKDDPTGEVLSQIEEETHRISQILRGLLDFANPRPGPLEPCDLNDIISSFIPLVRPELAKNRITLELQLEPNLPLVQVVEREIKQILLNLVNNGREAMTAEGTLTIMTYSDLQRVYLAIQDTGSGLSAEVQQRLFEPFFSTKGLGGNGLGLSVVHGIILAYAGTIQAKNNDGVGCTFEISLPQVNQSERVLETG